MITRTFLDSFSTADFTRDYVIILRTTDILFDRLGGMRFFFVDDPRSVFSLGNGKYIC